MSRTSKLVTFTPLWVAPLAVVAAMIGYRLGDSYIARLPDHRGFFLVSVDDEVAVDPPRRPLVTPRHAVLVVIDGLRRDAAEEMESFARLRDVGHCRIMNNGELTVSRPVFAVLSSGLEADRTGSRNNDEKSPVAVDSIWQSARRAGRYVSGSSCDPYWQQLFPDGFEPYLHRRQHEVNLFAATELSDINMIHPGYVDVAGHYHGASSDEYRAAVARVDKEVSEFLNRLDFEQDLVVVTSDHGHTSSGGHGGPQSVIADVLTCYAGRGVRPEKAIGRMDARTLGPSFAVLAGVPFPRHMRALEDDLDTIWEIVSTETLGEGYRRDREAAVQRFRAANRAQLAEWLDDDSDPSWSELYERERRGQLWRLAGAIALLLIGLGLSIRLRRMGWKRALGFIAWLVGTLIVTGAVYTAFRGTFDFTSINMRQPYVRASMGVSLAVAALATLVHGGIWRSASAYLSDQLTLVIAVMSLDVAHLVIYGDPLGFPLPSRFEMFWPFIASAVTLANGVWTAGISAIVLLVGLAHRAERPAE